MNKETNEHMPEDADTIEGLTSTSLSRRRFLAGSGAVAGAAVVIAACGGDDEADTRSGQTTTSKAPGAAADVSVAAFAAGLEVLAVDTYKAALSAATAGRLGPVPPAGAEFVKTALSQHEQHRDAWNKVVRGAGQPEVTAPNAQLKPIVDAELGKVSDFPGAARLALMLEEIAAATYLDAVPKLNGKDAIKQAASIQAIDAKHVAILLFVLGRYPVPDVFAKTEKAAKLA